MNEKNVDKRRKKKAKKKKQHKLLKALLTIIGILLIGVVVFVATVKLLQPSFDFSALIPKDVAVFVDARLNNKKPVDKQEETTTKPTTTQTTTRFYLESADFEFEKSKKGAFVGNLLNGGKVERDGGYIYHIVDGKGIYRFYPETESYNVIYKTDRKISSLNSRGDFFYVVFYDTHELFKIKKGTTEATKVADGVLCAYLYDKYAYCVGTDNTIKIVNNTSFEPTTLYTAPQTETLSFVGISLDKVFFTSSTSYNTSFYAVDINTMERKEFMPATTINDIKSISLENGYFYYYKQQADSSYSLIRQKVGSEKTVELVKNVALQMPVCVDNNKVFYTDVSSSTVMYNELNMNSMQTKTMLTAKGVDMSSLICQHGGEYDFIIAKSNDGELVYRASSNLTSSTNVMKLKNGSWSY